MPFSQASVELLLELRRITDNYLEKTATQTTPYSALMAATTELIEFLATPLFLRWPEAGAVAREADAKLREKLILPCVGEQKNYLGCVDETGQLYLQMPRDFLFQSEPELGLNHSPETAGLTRLMQLVPALFCLRYLQRQDLPQGEDLEPVATEALRYGLQQQIQFLSVLHDLFPREVFLEVMSSAKGLLLELTDLG